MTHGYYTYACAKCGKATILWYPPNPETPQPTYERQCLKLQFAEDRCVLNLYGKTKD
jgi:hypothetical protein